MEQLLRDAVAERVVTQTAEPHSSVAKCGDVGGDIRLGPACIEQKPFREFHRLCVDRSHHRHRLTDGQERARA